MNAKSKTKPKPPKLPRQDNFKVGVERTASLEPRLWPSRKTTEELLSSAQSEARACPWTQRLIVRHPQVMRYPDSYRYQDTGKACPWRVARAAGFREFSLDEPGSHAARASDFPPMTKTKPTTEEIQQWQM